jgi:GDPmannose 4,6-dehydratase
MWLMLQQPAPDDFVIATGEKHKVKEFLELACEYLGLDSADVLVHNEKYFRPLDVNRLIGDASKAKEILGWEPKVTFKELVRIMVQKDFDRWEDHLNGKIFPWDAINDPGAY